MTAAAVIVLRRKRPDLVRPYRTMGYPVVPALFVLGAAGVVVSTLINSPRESLMGLVLIFSGCPSISTGNAGNRDSIISVGCLVLF